MAGFLRRQEHPLRFPRALNLIPRLPIVLPQPVRREKLRPATALFRGITDRQFFKDLIEIHNDRRLARIQTELFPVRTLSVADQAIQAVIDAPTSSQPATPASVSTVAFGSPVTPPPLPRQPVSKVERAVEIGRELQQRQAEGNQSPSMIRNQTRLSQLESIVGQIQPNQPSDVRSSALTRSNVLIRQLSNATLTEQQRERLQELRRQRQSRMVETTPRKKR